jgi:D-alanine--poly(phosphoribitol) ligase subunit 2
VVNLRHERIRRFIEDQFLVEFDETLNADSDLFKEGVIDSFGYVQFCRFLEKTFGITFSEAEMTGNVMVSLRQFDEGVGSKLDPASG